MIPDYFSSQHLNGYRWAAANCSAADHVLKADDDTFVDVNHLRSFLPRYGLADRPGTYYLCHVLRHARVIRDAAGPQGKSALGRDEYADDEYPTYCTGAAYLTNLDTVRKVIGRAEGRRPIHIDDAFVTGLAAPTDVTYFDWSYAFLNNHDDSRERLIHGSDFTPELMVAYDLRPDEVVKLHLKSETCRVRNCYESTAPLIEDLLRPTAIPSSGSLHTEL